MWSEDRGAGRRGARGGITNPAPYAMSSTTTHNDEDLDCHTREGSSGISSTTDRSRSSLTPLFACLSFLLVPPTRGVFLRLDSHVSTILGHHYPQPAYIPPSDIPCYMCRCTGRMCPIPTPSSPSLSSSHYRVPSITSIGSWRLLPFSPCSKLCQHVSQRTTWQTSFICKRM